MTKNCIKLLILLILFNISVASSQDATSVDIYQGDKTENRVMPQSDQEVIDEQNKKTAYFDDLKSGRRKPANIDEAAIFYEASDGESLGSHPKLRPDQKFYRLMVKLQEADESGVFIGISVAEQYGALMAAMQGYSIRTNRSYYKFNLPAE